MNFSECEIVVMSAAIVAVLMAGSLRLRANLFLYSIETMLIAVATAFTGASRGEPTLYYVAGAIALIKGICIPVFLNKTIDHVKIQNDVGTKIVAPLAMHGCIALLGISYMLVTGLPVPPGEVRAWPGAMSGISLVFTGLVLMLTRRVAISQIIGFLVVENGIYLFALTQTRGMPMIVEMGVILDVLVGVMIAGLLVFKIQKSFEHIDVSQLVELKD